jgi:hypothetical protein
MAGSLLGWTRQKKKKVGEENVLCQPDARLQVCHSSGLTSADASANDGALNWRRKSKEIQNGPSPIILFFPMYRQTQSRPFRATYCLFLLLDINQSKNRKKGGRDVIRSEGDQGLLLLSHALPLIITVIITPVGWMSRREKKTNSFFFSMRRNRSGLIKFFFGVCVCVCVLKAPPIFTGVQTSRGFLFLFFFNPWIYLWHLSRTLQVLIL